MWDRILVIIAILVNNAFKTVQQRVKDKEDICRRADARQRYLTQDFTLCWTGLRCVILEDRYKCEDKKDIREGRLPNMTTENKMIRINDIEAAKKLVSAAVKCPFDIDIVSKGKIFIDAKSILGVLSLGEKEALELKYDGYDENFESVVAGMLS